MPKVSPVAPQQWCLLRRQRSSVPTLVTHVQYYQRTVLLWSFPRTINQMMWTRCVESRTQVALLRIAESTECWPYLALLEILSTKITLCSSQKTRWCHHSQMLRSCPSPLTRSSCCSPVMVSGTSKPLKRQSPTPSKLSTKTIMGKNELLQSCKRGWRTCSTTAAPKTLPLRKVSAVITWRQSSSKLFTIENKVMSNSEQSPNLLATQWREKYTTRRNRKLSKLEQWILSSDHWHIKTYHNNNLPK